MKKVSKPEGIIKEAEPTMIINGTQLTSSQSMAVRVAIANFKNDLNTEGLGNDEHGVEMTAAYLLRLQEVENLIFTHDVQCDTLIPLKNDDGQLFDHVTLEYIFSLRNTYPADTTHFTPSCFKGTATFYKIDKQSCKALLFNAETSTWIEPDEDIIFSSARKNLIDIGIVNSYLNQTITAT